MDKYSFLNAANTQFFADLYDQYLENPDSVEASWRAFFQGFDFARESYGDDFFQESVPQEVSTVTAPVASSVASTTSSFFFSSDIFASFLGTYVISCSTHLIMIATQISVEICEFHSQDSIDNIELTNHLLVIQIDWTDHRQHTKASIGN